jgi:hypothetical protein
MAQRPQAGYASRPCCGAAARITARACSEARGCRTACRLLPLPLNGGILRAHGEGRFADRPRLSIGLGLMTSGQDRMVAP